MRHQIPLPASAKAREEQPETHGIAHDLAFKRTAISNVIFYGASGSGDRQWVLIDAGMPGFSRAIVHAAKERFGENARPSAIVLTHGHFDHVGALKTLAEEWDVPVFAHPLELPYLNGEGSYPPPDPKVGGGLMSLLSPLYPRGPVDVANRLQPLPQDGSLPGMPGWSWLHTPGHSPGHVALWRSTDRVLIAGDAFITTNQESAYAVAVQLPELHGPPMYYTQNWDAAEQSVERLAQLEPELVVTGHGLPMSGPEVRRSLKALAADFRRVAVPEKGRYVTEPTHVEDGTAYCRP